MVVANSQHDLLNKARCCFDFDSSIDIVLQQYNSEWEEFIDCENFEELRGGEKLKIVVKYRAAINTGSDVQLKGSESIQDVLLVSEY